MCILKVIQNPSVLLLPQYAGWSGSIYFVHTGAARLFNMYCSVDTLQTQPQPAQHPSCAVPEQISWH